MGETDNTYSNTYRNKTSGDIAEAKPKADAFGTSGLRGGGSARTIAGIIKRVVFQNTETGFTILNVFSNGKFITASGVFFDKPLIDLKIKLKGQFAYHKKYGYQFNFTQYESSASNTRTAIIEYLSSNIFKGIGRATAGKIYEKFKEKTLDIIDNEPERLRDVNGIGAVKLGTILEGLKESYGLRKAVMFFKPYQFSDYQIKAVYNQFQDKSVLIAKENPYLFTEIKGIGFKKADIMAEKLGIKRNDPNRVKEAIKYIINQICESSGNSYVYYRDIMDGIKEIIGDLKEFDLKNYLNDLIKEKKILLDFKEAPGFKCFAGGGASDFSNVKDDNQIRHVRIYLPVYYYCELGAAKELKRIAKYVKPVAENDIYPDGGNNNGNNNANANASEEQANANPFRQAAPNPPPIPNKTLSAEALDKYLERDENRISLTEEQKIAVLNALRYKVSIISGGPGTGKSTVIKTIVNLCKEKKIALTSLSGKAAQRLSDIVNPEHAEDTGNGTDISTIHRLLKAQYDRQTNESFFTYNENNRLPHDLIVIDEMSMVDVIIFYKLLKAVKDAANLVFVGDVNQIPSVSPGDVLRDLIYSDPGDRFKIKTFFPVTFLTKVFRQNEGGLININAHNLLSNKGFITSKKSAGKGESTAPAGSAGDGSFIIKYKREYDAPKEGKNELLKDFTLFVKRVSDKRIGKKTDNAGDAHAAMRPAAGLAVPVSIFDDIQILTPMRKGDLGYFNLNNVLQDIFNPLPAAGSAEDIFICNGVQFRLYDKVMQKKNNYDFDVFNGDTGYIVDIDHAAKSLTVNFSNYGNFAEDKNKTGSKFRSNFTSVVRHRNRAVNFMDAGRRMPDMHACQNSALISTGNEGAVKLVKYDFLDIFENISLAYALSIHKAQGSEFDNVIILFHQAHYLMLKKNLLYTAITRGKKNVVIFGTFRAFSIAINSKEEVRNSGLKDRLLDEYGINNFL
ncbi:MAG: ATP-dependent RecD-like DNA helicase [Deltaproteobacteria bacterium]|nr:ATP-dependent RecD-like DNA helicase [Deltaproteobacteria bacterium]